MKENNDILKKRSKIVLFIRNFLSEEGYSEFETPILSFNSFEGANQFIVPYKMDNLYRYYCLSQSPQIYKQLLIMSCYEKYFQICKCFRYEKPRANRQFEFTQLDIELAFATEEKIYALMESLMSKLMKSVFNIDIDIPFKRISYSSAIKLYGSENPDLRFKNELIQLDPSISALLPFFSNDEKYFALLFNEKIKSVNMKELSDLNKTFINSKMYFLFSEVLDDSLIVKNNKTNIFWQELYKLYKNQFSKENTLLIMSSNNIDNARNYAGIIRTKTAELLNITNPNVFKFC